MTIRTLLDKCGVAGWDHHEGSAAASKLEVGQRVLLSRDPRNEFDPNAITVVSASFMLGFVPKASNGALALLMDEGRKVDAYISGLDLESKNPWKKCAITVTIEVD